MEKKIDKKMLLLLKKKRQMAYNNPNSILKRYDEYLESHGIYHSLNSDIFQQSIKGHIDLCDGILKLYNEAILGNEKEALLEDLYIIGYDRDKLTELILEAFNDETASIDLWACGDLLYRIKNYKYISQYIKIVENKKYAESRQMIIVLLGKSKKPEFIPVLKELLEDKTVEGHALDALSNYYDEDIMNIMNNYTDCESAWIRNIAKRYIKKYSVNN